MKSIAENITEKKIFEDGRLFVAPTKIKDVVTLEGSVLGGSNMLPRNHMEVPSFASELYDAGTKEHTKEELREALAARGANLSFSADGDRTYFSGSCLPEDLGFLIATIAECLGTATFPAAEIAVVHEQMLGELKERKTNTRAQIASEFARQVYDKGHVNYVETDAFLEKAVTLVTRKDLVDFRSKLGRKGLVVAVTGDVKVPEVVKSIEKSFGKLAKGSFELITKARNKKPAHLEEKHLEIPSKSNIDVYVGAFVPLTYDDPLYLPFTTVLLMLGDGFASHLMQTIRERDGLTYGVYTRPFTGFSKNAEGVFRVLATFSPAIYDKGIAAIRKEIKIFFASHLNQEELDRRKDDMLGTYLIRLSTTGGLAMQLLQIGIQDKELSFIDTYLDKVRAITVEDIKNASKLIPLTKLTTVAAGTFAK